LKNVNPIASMQQERKTNEQTVWDEDNVVICVVLIDTCIPVEWWVGSTQNKRRMEREHADLLPWHSVPVCWVHTPSSSSSRVLCYECHSTVRSSICPRLGRLLSASWCGWKDISWYLGCPCYHRLPAHCCRDRAEDISSCPHYGLVKPRPSPVSVISVLYQCACWAELTPKNGPKVCVSHV